MPRFSARPRTTARTTILALLIGLLSAYPLAMLVWQGVCVPSAWPAWGAVSRDPAVWTALLHTLLTSLGAAAAALLGGGGLALLLTRIRLPGRRIFEGLLGGLLVLPPFVTGLAFLGAYGPGGLLGQVWQTVTGRLPVGNGIYGGWAVTYLLALHGLPLVYLLLRPALRGQGRLLEEAARSSGLGGWRVLWRITLPVVAPTLLAAGLLVFVTSASEYGIPAVVGLPGGYNTLTTLIMQELAYGAGGRAFQKAVVLALLLSLLGLLALRIPSSQRHPGPGEGRMALPSDLTSVPKPLEAAIGGILALFFLTALLLPLLALLLVAATRAYGLPPLPANLTLAHFLGLVQDPAVRQAVGTSLLLGLVTGAGVGVLGLVIASASDTRPVDRILSLLGSLPYTLPGSTFAIAAILAWDRSLPGIGSLYGTPSLLLLAYVGRFLVFGILSGRLAWAAVGQQRQEAAHGAGADAWERGRWIQWPLGAGPVLAGMLWVMLAVLHELTISTLLVGPGTVTVGVQVMQMNQAGDPSGTAALAVLLAAGTFLPAALTGSRLAPERRSPLGRHIHRRGFLLRRRRTPSSLHLP